MGPGRRWPRVPTAARAGGQVDPMPGAPGIQQSSLTPPLPAAPYRRSPLGGWSPTAASATSKARPELSRDSSAPLPARTLATAGTVPPLTWPRPLPGTTELLPATLPHPPGSAPPTSPASSWTPKKRAGGPEWFGRRCSPGILLQNALFCKQSPPGALCPFTPSPSLSPQKTGAVNPLCIYVRVCVGRSFMSESLRPLGVYRRPRSSVQGILQARILQWVAISFSRGSSRPWDGTQVSCFAGGLFTF